eukprot:jgi/Psemu1/241897/estExt_Genewise1.C_2510036
MTSHASEMPPSPGFVPHYDMYSNHFRRRVVEEEDPSQELSLIKNENQRLKQSLTRVQTECEELRDESNYNRAKIMELSDLVSSSPSPSSPSSSSSSNSPKQTTTTAMKDSLIAKKKEKENAELTLAVNRLEVELYQSELKLEELQVQKKANNKLLLEMGDVIRALNAIDVECDPALIQNRNNNPENLTLQQMSIKNIKLKVEAITKDRELLRQRCRELEGECLDQQIRVETLESQFHHFANNTPKLSSSKGFVNNNNNDDEEDAMTLTTCSRTTQPHSPFSASCALSIASSASTIDDDSNYSRASHQVPQQSVDVIQFEKELALYKEKEEQYANELFTVKKSQQIQKDTIQKLQKQNENTSNQLNAMRDELEKTKVENRNIAIKRDEFKSNLHAIMTHYKDLKIEHHTTKEQMKELQSHVDRLEAEVERANNRQENQGEEQHDAGEKDGAEEQSQGERTTRVQKSFSDDEVSMEDLTVAYGRAKKRIKELELRLIQAAQLSLLATERGENGELRLHPAINRCKQMERERDEIQRKLNNAMEETRLAKLEAQSHREASKQFVVDWQRTHSTRCKMIEAYPRGRRQERNGTNHSPLKN